MLRKKQRSNEKWETPEWGEPQRIKLKKCIKLQSRTEVKPYFCNYSQFLFNPANYLKCDSRTLDFSELCSITLSYVSFSKVKWALIAFQITSHISETTVREKPGLTICLAWSYMELYGAFPRALLLLGLLLLEAVCTYMLAMTKGSGVQRRSAGLAEPQTSSSTDKRSCEESWKQAGPCSPTTLHRNLTSVSVPDPDLGLLHLGSLLARPQLPPASCSALGSPSPAQQPPWYTLAAKVGNAGFICRLPVRVGLVEPRICINTLCIILMSCKSARLI